MPSRKCVTFFFFSSRRRHTRCSRDWSSDVCSSDLMRVLPVLFRMERNGVLLDAAKLEAQSHERSEEHTSELQSRLHIVCRPLLEKKKTKSCGTLLWPMANRFWTLSIMTRLDSTMPT